MHLPRGPRCHPRPHPPATEITKSVCDDAFASGTEGRNGSGQNGKWKIEIVERSAEAIGFELLPKRWIVERTFAWISRFRRIARDFERYATTVAAFIRLAMIRIMLRRLTKPCLST